jgi:hypothetical protein
LENLITWGLIIVFAVDIVVKGRLIYWQRALIQVQKDRIATLEDGLNRLIEYGQRKTK